MRVELPSFRWSYGLALALAIGVLIGLTAESRTRLLALNTLLLVAGTWAISLPLGAVLGLLLAKSDVPGRRTAAALVGSLLFVPLYLQTAAWQAGFGLQGWYSQATGAPPPLAGWRGAIWVHAMGAVPWVAVIVGLGMRSEKGDLEEQALLDGPPRRVFFRVTLRRAANWVGVAALWVAATTAGEMTVTDLFLIRTYAEEIYTKLNLGGWSSDEPLDLWSGTIITTLLVLCACFACRSLSPKSIATPARPVWQWKPGPHRTLITGLLCVLLVLLVGVPLGNLAYHAGVQITPTDTAPVRSWSAAKCLAVVGSSPIGFIWEFAWSLTVAFFAATAATFVALGLAWLARGRPLLTLPALLTTAIGLAVPGPLLGLCLISLLAHRNVPVITYLYDQTIFAPWLAQTIRAVPLATLILWHALASVPSGALENARLEGAGWLTRLLRIGLPGRWSALFAAWLVALIVAIGELPATVLVVPPGMTTLPVRIFGLLHYGVEDQVAGICLAMFVMTLLAAWVLFVGFWLAGRRKKHDPLD